MADDAREAIAALDSYQLRQILTIAVEDIVFRTKLMLDPGGRVDGKRIPALRAAASRRCGRSIIESLPGDAQNRYYH